MVKTEKYSTWQKSHDSQTHPSNRILKNLKWFLSYALFFFFNILVALREYIQIKIINDFNGMGI